MHGQTNIKFFMLIL